jgi:hypothetical protein
MNNYKIAFLIVLIFLLFPQVVRADDSSIAGENPKADPSKEDIWQFTFIPYLWLPSVDARATVEGTTQKVKLTFSDILDSFDLFGIMGRFEAWKGRWGLIFDLLYADLDGDFRNSNPLIPINPILNELNVEIRQAIVDFAVSYRIFERPLRKEHHFPILTIEPICGARYTYLKQELTPTIRNVLTPKLGGSKDWMEPYIGSSIRLQITEKIGCGLRWDFGGFGIGSASTKTWKLAAGIGYRFSKRYQLRLGYEIYDIDYSNGSGNDEFGIDGRLYGPKIGLMYYF